MKHTEKIIGILLVLFAIGFNLWTYRLEPTAKLDPNDNTFQYALVYRTNQIWDYAQLRCSSEKLKVLSFKVTNFALCTQNFLLLFDHWVPNWAQGYNLPYYYTHIPQIVIVASYKFVTSLLGYFVTWFNFSKSISLFSYYHIMIYLLLSLFPLSLFLALRIINLSWITAGIGALIASQISTDGLYGLDPPSFLFRGYGLSSQLFAMIWLPLALAYAWRLFSPSNEVTHKRSFVPAILALSATTAGHLGIGIIAFISVGVVGISSCFSSLGNLSQLLLKSLKKLSLIYIGVLLLLGYWIIPILKDGNYHNISVWDPIWKFDSYGYREVLKNLFNGDLFDFGRFPILTVLVFVGLFSALGTQHSALSILFIFWLLFYFGRTTWGGLVNLIPGMEEFHLSRFIVGLHIAGLFLIPIGIEYVFEKTKLLNKLVLSVLCVLFVLSLIFSVYPQTLRYSSHNDTLVKQANDNFTKVESDTAALLETLNSALSTNPGRVYFGRGGTWGKTFLVAETPMFLYMSTFGIPTLTWLPETWSPNSDTEQYFSEDVSAHYILYNIKYVVTPIDLPKDKIQPFWKPLTTGKTWKLYEVSPELVEGSGYISTGFRPAIVSSSKLNFTNVVRLWIQSDSHTKNLYPELTFDKNYPKTFGLPNFRMLDEVTYRVPDGSNHNLFAEVPRYLPAQAGLPAGKAGELPNSKLETRNSELGITSQSNDSDMIFRATVEVPEACENCIIILHQTYHPSWKATVDGKSVNTFTVFPFYTAVKLESAGLPAQAGQHEVIFSYQPSVLKKFLLFISFISLTIIFWITRLKRT